MWSSTSGLNMTVAAAFGEQNGNAGEALAARRAVFAHREPSEDRVEI